MDDLFEEPEATDDPGPRRERTLTEEEVQQASRHRRVRLLVGAGCLLLGIGAVALALATRGDDDGESSSKQTAEAGATTTAAGTDPTTSVESATTDLEVRPGWPFAVSGRPAAFGALKDAPPADAGDLPDGFYLWTDFDGWHLWLVGGGEADKVTITSDNAISKADPTGGPVDVQVFGNVVAMRRGSATEPVVGIDINPGYYAKNMIVAVEGALPVHIGGTAKAMPQYFALRVE